MKKLALSTLTLGILVSVGCSQIVNNDDTQIPSQDAPITLFVADQLITMSDQYSDNVDTVAVQNGIIIDVGQQEQLTSKYATHSNVLINDIYQNSVLTPGFVEPHLHIWLSGILMGTEFITPADWKLPHGEAKGVQTEKQYMQRLNELNANTPKGQPLITWGYHQYFHGENMSRELLDSISTERPIIVWHRSFHEIYFNSAALAMFGWQEADWQGDSAAYAHLHWDKGHAYENGAKIILADVLKFLIESGTFATGMERTKDYIHSGGITTAVDPGIIITPDMYQQMTNILLDESLPMDYWLIPAGNFTYSKVGYDAEKGKQLAEQQTVQFASVEQIQWLPKYIKLFSDGAMYSQLMQLKDGYIDGHHGEWLQTPAELEDSMRPYWHDDYTIMVHANGDLGFEAAIDIVDKLNAEYPRSDHRTGFHHLGITDVEDIPRAVKQGSNFSVNPYYTHILAENYSANGVGAERAEVMARGRSFIDAGGLLSLHSDAPMAPAQPLSLVWAAVNRIGLSGETVMGPQERISVDEAMRAITIDAAYTARLEDQVGSIDIGKQANFTVLEQSPYQVQPEEINQINIQATIYQGKVHSISQSNAGMQMTQTTQTALNALNQHQGEHGHHHDHDHDVCETSLLFQKVISAM